MQIPKLPHWPVHTGVSSKDSVALMSEVLGLLGNPQDRLSNVIHVGGTNGKGSTIAFIASILREQGKSVNVYTSPHILDFCERFSLDGKNAEKEQVFNAFEEVRAVCEQNKIMPTVLEASTIACFYLFTRYPAEYNIIEVCMGGQYDCTNVFTAQNLACTVITSISKDHTKYLGNTIAEIAFHKAGIQKAGVQSIVGKQKEIDANTLLFNYGRKFGIPTDFFGADYNISILESDEPLPENARVLYQDNKWELYLPMPSLKGMHQMENLATALRVCSLSDIDLTKAGNAISKTKWIGRLQRVHNIKFPHNIEFWFDGAHNQGGAKVLCEWILSTQKDDVQDYIIVGKSKGADQTGFISSFKGVNVVPIFVTVKGEILPETSTNLLEFARSVGVTGIDGKTFEHTLAHDLPKDKPIRVIGCGSLYLLKDMLA